MAHSETHEQAAREIDVEQVRRDTPTCLNQSYLDNAGSALPTTTTLNAVIDHLRLEAEVGGYVAMDMQQDRIDACPASLGALVGVRADQVALQTSATGAWMRAVLSIPFEEGDRILTTSSEYATNVLPLLQLASRFRLSVEFVPDGADGVIDPSALADLLDHRVRAVAITHAASQNGLLVDAPAIASVIADSQFSPWFLLDACQSIGQLPVDMPSLGVDLLAATGRKFLRAPRGTGFLALSDRALGGLQPVPPDMFGSHWDGAHGYTENANATRFQSFETSYAGVLGLGAAADYALDLGLDAIRLRIDALAESLRSQLSEIPGVRVLDRGSIKTGIVVFACPGESSFERAAELLAQGITVNVIKRVTNPRDYESYNSSCVLRASPHYFNSADDICALVAAVAAFS